MSDARMERFELFQLLDTLARPVGAPVSQDQEWLPGTSGDPAAALAALSGGEGRVFRVKLGYNPNSSSLGTSVVVLLWGIGLAGLLFQLVGTWLMTAQAGPALPDGSSPDGSGGSASDSAGAPIAGGLQATGHDRQALPSGAGEASGETS